MKKKHSNNKFARIGVQVLFFLLFPSAFSTAFNGVKYLAGQIYKQEVVTWTPFLIVLVALLAFTVVFGRFFCGYVCAFGSLGDWLFLLSGFVQKKIVGRKKVFRPSEKAIAIFLYLKYLVLLGIVVACVLNLFVKVAWADPWEVFASLRAGNFNLHGKVMASVLLGIILVGMLFVERFFCLFLCPMGAVFDLLPMLPLTIYNRDKDKCIAGCSQCIRVCPAAISLGEKDSKHGECFQCGKCAEKCPVGNVRLGFRKWIGTQLWLTALKATILLALCLWAIGL